MKTRRWDVVIVAVVCTALGLVTGWAADQRTHYDDHAAEEAAAVETEEEHAVTFSAEALANLGVVVRPAEPRTWVREQRIAAVVESTPFTERPVRALFGGRVTEVLTEPGRVAAPGDPLVRLLRAPIPLPEPDITADMLRPAHDEIHGSIRNLRSAKAEEAIARQELERLESFRDGDLPLVPGQRVIELEYEVERARVSYELAAHELERHGFSHEQIEAAATGGHPAPFGAMTVQRALVHHGLWSPRSEKLLDALPATTRQEPLAIATIGELGAKGLLTNDLVAWLERDAGAARHFLAIGSLLLRGHAFEDLQRLAAEGALEAEVVVRAPEGAPDWDVAAIAVRAGSQVSPADPLLTLRDPRQLRLRIHPLGGEVALVELAAAEGLPCRATPALPGTGPTLEGLQVDYVAADSTHGAHAWARFENEPITAGADGAAYRTWRVREGTAYELRVPVDTIEAAIVLPRGAVLEDGPDRMVLVPHDDTFEELPVIVAYENSEVTVLRLAEQTRLTADTPVVVSGAFEIAMALHAEESAGGHHHHH